ncbi:uncharacterized protein LOC119373434 [Rhipicephalus sanguineus]|uniref:uncharacterized protein LOC119373434 n=1 Tax=Rhipicephalus sanguineus TaxID=34632 RepID=UPI00189629FD|nr:uncharacterized protein LOC119373434 [Rhipicephalus sanguineus]
MAEKPLFVLVFLLTSMTLSSGILKNRLPLKRKLDIRKFVGTSQPIWTYTTTTTRKNLFCKVDEMRSLTHGSIFFIRTYFRLPDRVPVSKGYEGLFPRDQANFMQLRKSAFHSPVFYAKERLLYYNQEYRCAVMRVEPAVHGYPPYYELRIWNSTVIRGPRTICTTRFLKYGDPGRDIYGPQCQRLLHEYQYKEG